MHAFVPSPPCRLGHPLVDRSQYRVVIPVRRVAEPAPPITLAFGRAVRRLRAQAGYSEEQLGSRAGLSAVQVTGIERGTSNIPLATMERLAAAFGIRVSELMAEVERQRAT